MRNVLFISYYFPPMGGAGVQRSAKFVKYLPELGWRPIVVTAAPETYQVHREFQLDRTIGDGLEKVDHEVHYIRDPEPRRLRRFLEHIRIFPLFWFFLYPLFWEPELWWALAAIWKGLRLTRRKEVAAIYTSSGPFCTVLTGLVLRLLTRKPWIADLRDPWTENFRAVWPSAVHRWVERRFARFALRRADVVVANTPVAEEMLLEVSGRDWRSHFRVIPNGYDEDDFAVSSADGARRPFTLAHVGTFGSGVLPPLRTGIRRLGDLIKARPQGYDTSTYSARYLLEAILILFDKGSLLSEDLQVVLVGHVPQECHEQIRRFGLEKSVTCSGYMNHTAAVRRLMAADVLWLPLPVPAGGRPLQQVSGKLYEYMRSGKPVLGLLPPGDAHDFLQESGLGFFADPRDPEDIARVLLNLYAQHRNGGIHVQPNWEFIRRFERKELTRQLGKILDNTRVGA